MIKALVISLFLFFTLTVAAQEEAMISVERANLRATPSTKSKVITTLKYDDLVEIIKDTGAWLKVRAKGHVGWLHQSVVAINLYGSPETPPENVITTPQQPADLPASLTPAGIERSDLMMKRIIEGELMVRGITGVSVSVQDAVATLTGTIRKHQLADAMKAAMEADIKRVVNRLKIK